jgi:tetraprenyl-beta-curcumene synthase
MDSAIAARRPARAGGLPRTAALYWLRVFPLIRGEHLSWTARARHIPDRSLRELALGTIAEEQRNVEGAAAFAVLAARAHRAEVASALSAFQIIYDYVDTLVEQEAPDTLRNGFYLHHALRVALAPAAVHCDYYRHHPSHRDGGYLCGLIERCASCLAELPSSSAMRAQAALAARRIQIFQALNHNPDRRSRAELERWALAQTRSQPDLRWWESAAASASSLPIFALIAAGSHAGLREHTVQQIHRAYHPWIGALHVLLDSMLDHEQDLAAGRHSLIEHYRSPQQAAERIGAIAHMAARRTLELPDGRRHHMILAAMVSFYVCSAQARTPHGALVRRAVLRAIGGPARPAMFVMRARAAAQRVLATSG